MGPMVRSHSNAPGEPTGAKRVAERQEFSLAPSLSLEESDEGFRTGALQRLQQLAGNISVQRLVKLGPVQRYRVRVPRNADCDTVLDWMENSNPHAPNWAKTTARFRWRGGYNVTGAPPEFRASISNPGVTVRKRVDMPVWRPRGEAMGRAWSEAMTTLRRHEGEHEDTADRWRETLQERLSSLDLPIDASTRREAEQTARSLVNDEWNTWLNEHQADQNQLDPYSAPFNCPSTTGG